jgi:hypothetical protein
VLRPAASLCALPYLCCVQVVDNWYPGDAKKDKGVLLMVTAGKEGAVTGGEGFMAVSK